jgi:outer membrane protein OmpA-like peptidoglycan-associated protein
MTKYISKWIALLCAIGAYVAVMPGTATAQEGEQVAPIRIGLLGGANFNSVGVGGETPLPIPVSEDLSDGTGLGPYGGLLFEYNPGLGKVLGIHARVAYDDRTAVFTGGGREVTAGVGYFTIEPGMQLNLGSPNFHFVVGPSINVLARNDFTIDTSGVVTENVEYGRLNDITYTLWGGVSYDIHLGEMSDNGTQWYLTPFFEGSWMVDQVKTPIAEADNIDDSWSTVTVRGGLQLKYGFGGPTEEPMPEVVITPSVTPEIGVVVTPPASGVATARPMQEYLPLLNYVFFDQDGDNAIPGRYVRLNTSSAQAFSESELTELQRPSAGSGRAEERTRAERQMDIYHNALNVIGDRMQANPSASIRVVGSAPNAADGSARAQQVKDYLVSAFGIPADRITVEGKTRPENASGTRRTPKEDLALIVEENHRVEILSNDQSLLRPVNLNVYQDQPVESDLVLSVASNVPVSRWEVEIKGNGYTATYGPFYDNVARINATPILGSRDAGTYTAEVTAFTSDGEETVGTSSFTLRKQLAAPEKSTRYSILFEYDESQSVAKYETFLRNTVAPEIPNGATVYIHGHTDIAGMEGYNDTLSMQRAENARGILAKQLESMGRTATFEAYGMGEAAYRAPFNNDSPEGRYYNRTVMIEIVAPGASMSEQ